MSLLVGILEDFDIQPRALCIFILCPWPTKCL